MQLLIIFTKVRCVIFISKVSLLNYKGKKCANLPLMVTAVLKVLPCCVQIVSYMLDYLVPDKEVNLVS